MEQEAYRHVPYDIDIEQALLGAILAVPLTASVKVLFQRYVWHARIAPQTIGGSRREVVA